MPDMIYAKMHERHGSQVLALADPELIGSELSNGRLRFRVSAHFYAGTLMPKQEALDLLRNFPNANLLGSMVLSAVEEGIVAEDAILWVQDQETGQQVPHAMIIHI
ncbi:MAG: DUF424 family protein [Candidatus Hodarchaeales archaeon]